MRKPWTEEDLRVLAEMYPDHSSAEIARRVNHPIESVYRRAYSLGLRKSEAFLKSSLSGRLKHPYKEAWFPKGHVPFNKGKKWSEYLPPESMAKSLRTTFTKGHLPKNTKADGVISIRRDSHNRSYKYIRISRGKWIPLHVHNWEKANGPVPEGYIVVFRSADNMNCDLQNLELISRDENMRRNTWHRYPPEIKDVMRKIKKLRRQINGKEQNTGPEGSPVRDNRVA